MSARIRSAPPLGVIVGIAAFCSLLRLPSTVVTADHDLSWQRALGHLLTGDARAGADWVLSYGPLGFLYGQTYAADLFWAHMAWQVAVAAGLGVVFGHACRTIEGRGRQMAFAFLVVCLPHPGDQVILLALLSVTLSALRVEPAPRGRVALIIACCAVFGLVKFNFLLAGGACAAALVGHVVATRGALAGAAAAVGALGLYAAAWLGAGERLVDWPLYVSRTAELAVGYAEAGAFKGEGFQLVCGIVACFALAGAAAVGLRRRPGAALGALATLLVLGLAYKHGFVRHEGAHTTGFFGFAAAAAFLVWWPRGLSPGRRRVQSVLLGVAVAVACLGLHHLLRRPPFSAGLWELPAWAAERARRNLGDLLAPIQLDVRLATAARAEAARHDLPRVRAAVGEGSIDVIGSSLGLLFMNGLEDRWQVRPVFQSNLAATPGLAALNGQHFRSERAPEFVLLDGFFMGRQLPMMADGPALLEVLRRYEPVLEEGGVALLRRARDGPLPPLLLLGKAEQGLLDPVDLAAYGEGVKVLRLRIRPSAVGWVRRNVLRAAGVRVELTLSDGRTIVHGLAPGMVAAGVLIDPYLPTAHDVVAFLEGRPPTRVRSFRLVIKARRRWLFQDRVELDLRAFPAR